MKGLPFTSGRQDDPSQPDNPGSAAAINSHRTGKYVTGTFLFVSVVAASAYAASPASPNVKSNAQPADGSSNVQLDLNASLDQSSPSASNTAQPDEAESSGVSANVSVVNGETSVKVNGQPVTPDASGSVSKSITTDNGTVNVNVSQNNTGNSFNSSSINSNTSSYSSSFNFSSEFNSNSGN